MTERENILMKVKRMLTLAEGAANEHEAALAAATAHKFMEKYNLCISDVSEISTDDTEIEEDTVFETGRLISWKRLLLHAVARCFNCSTLIYSEYRSRTMKLVGTKSDISVAKATYQYLESVVERLAKTNVKGTGRSYVNSYKRGLVTTLLNRLQVKSEENRREVRREATAVGTELAVVKNANLKSYMDKFGKYKAPESQIEWSAYDRGRQDGHSIGLDSQLGTDSRKLN